MKRISTLVLIIVLFFAGVKITKAQTALNEGFESLAFPPYGWNMGKIDTSGNVNNYCERVTASSNPISAPNHSGGAMCRYRSGYMNYAGNKFFLATKALDMRAIPVAGATCTFWMYRENVTTTMNDSLSVYVNDSALVTYYIGAAGPVSCQNLQITQIAPAAGPMGTVSRPYSSAPAVGAPGWVQYSVTIPNTWNTAAVYLVFMFTNRNTGATGGNIYIDDVVMNTYPIAQTYVSSTISFQNGSTVAQNTTNNLIVGINVSILGAGDPLVAGQQMTIGAAGIQFNTNGTSSPTTDISANSAKLWWTGGTNAFTGTANALLVQGGINPWLTNYTFTNGTFKFDNGNNYFWVTYDVPVAAIAGNCLDAEYVGIQLTGGTNGNTFVPTAFSIAGCRQIDVVYCGGNTPQYTAGTSWLNGSYTNNDYVQSVSMPGDFAPGINNNQNCCGPPISPWFSGPAPFSNHPPDYEKMTAVAPHLNVVATLTSASTPLVYPVTYQCGTWFSSNYIAGFIDWNHDGDFLDIISGINERIFQSPSMTSNQSIPTTFTVPYGGGTYLGATTFRIREWYAQPNIDACSPGYYGEVEDYTVVIVPQCGALMPPGFNKLWLGGFDNNWSNPQNWCPQNPPTALENTLIPGSSIHRPLIKNGTLATTKKLRIDGNDTLFIDCPTAGSLQINDSLNINRATAGMVVINAFSDTAVLSNGVIPTGLNTIFNGGTKKQKCQLVYTQGELMGQGMIGGDQVDELWFNIRTRNSTAPYMGFTVSYFYTNIGFCYNGGTAVMAPVITPGGVLYSGNVQLNTQVPGASGQYKLPLTTPLTWNGSANSLVIEICWDNGATSVLTDGMYCTTNLGCRNYLSYYSIGGSAISGCAVNAPGPGSAGFNTAALATSNNRPNITFKFHRNYSVFPIDVSGHWGNFGYFVPGYSNVTFKGAGGQHIDGTVNTKFYNLTINATLSTATVELWASADTITNLFTLTRGRYKLNGNPTAIRTTHFTNGTLGSLSWSLGNGMMLAESTPPNYGLFHWPIGTPPAYPTTYNIPFATSTGVQIPVAYKVNAGTVDLNLTTYHTLLPNNTPIPTGVQNINQSTWIAPPGTDNSAFMVDRFWQINDAGTGTNVDLTLTYSTAGPNEHAASGAGAYSAQYYNPCAGMNCGWNYPYLPGQVNGANTVMVPGVTYTNTWALSRNPQPLPVELLDFAAKAELDKVHLTWSTASEVNNDYFTVERTTNVTDFDFVAKLESQARGRVSSGILDYYTYDYKPLSGLQYYRLKQTDVDGKSSYSKLVPVEFGKKSSFDIKTVMNGADGSIKVYFAYDADAQVTYKLIDLMGKTILEGHINAAPGVNNYFTIDGSLVSKGVYNLMLTDGTRIVNRKLFPNSVK